jgi:ABC-type amino acid transport substrate-binding protein
MCRTAFVPERGDAVLRAVAVCFALLTAAAAQAQTPASTGRLEGIKKSGVVKIAYRADAKPFSFVTDTKAAAGFSIDLCKLVAKSIAADLGRGELKIEWVPVTLQTRFSAVATGKADMECGSSTVTLGRMKEVDFSNVVSWKRPG